MTSRRVPINKILACLLFVTSLWNVVASEYASASPLDKSNIKSHEQGSQGLCVPDEASCNESTDHGCDEESCQFHRCHLWHCAFPVARNSLFELAPTSNTEQGSMYIGSAATGYRSVLLEPPSA